jgi:hypothetical protein
VNRNNAQPFIKDPVVGTHNGTITTERLYQLFKKNKKPDNTGTDSEMIFESMKLFGVEETLKNVQGAIALVWYDWEKETINFARNHERELWWTFSEDGRKLLWASEPWFLKTVCNRHSMYAEKLVIEEPKLLPCGKWHSWEVPQKWDKSFEEAKVVDFADIPRPVFTRKEEASFAGSGVARSQVFSRGSAGGYSTYDSSTEWEKWLHENDQNNKVVVLGKPSQPRTEAEEKARLEVIRQAAEKMKKEKIVRVGKKAKFFKGWNGSMLDLEDYTKLVHKGCAWCTSVPEWMYGGDPEVIRFLDNQAFLCNSCMKDPEVLECCNLDEKRA